MKLMIVSKHADEISKHMNQVGYEAYPVYSSDLAVTLGKQKNIVLAVYIHSHAQPADHESVLAEMRAAGIRVILVTPREDKIVPYAVALGIYDFLTLPFNIEDLISVIENPNNNLKAAEWVKGIDYNLKPITKQDGQPQPATPPINQPSQPKPAARLEELSRQPKSSKLNPTQERPEQNERKKLLSLNVLKNKLQFFNLANLNKQKNNPDVRYITHHIITVWSPVGGSIKSLTALNLAITAAEQGFNTALINYDLASPILDKWFKIPNTPLKKVKDARGAGIMTFGPDIKPELAEKMTIDYGWGVKYLPAGNKLGNIGTPNMSVELLNEIIQKIYRRNVNGRPAVTIIDTSPVYELPTTYSALKNASILLITLSSKQESELVIDQLDELERLKIKPKIIEVIWGDSNSRSNNEQVYIPYNLDLFIQSNNRKTPYYTMLEDNHFKKLLEIATGG